jgi:hypothetical protein
VLPLQFNLIPTPRPHLLLISPRSWETGKYPSPKNMWSSLSICYSASVEDPHMHSPRFPQHRLIKRTAHRLHLDLKCHRINSSPLLKLTSSTNHFCCSTIPVPNWSDLIEDTDLWPAQTFLWTIVCTWLSAWELAGDPHSVFPSAKEIQRYYVTLMSVCKCYDI